MRVKVDDPFVQDALFLWRTRQVFLFPWMKENGFPDVVSYVLPDFLPVKLRRKENSSVSLFPELPENEAWK
jgi:hypothetical protein